MFRRVNSISFAIFLTTANIAGAATCEVHGGPDLPGHYAALNCFLARDRAARDRGAAAILGRVQEVEAETAALIGALDDAELVAAFHRAAMRAGWAATRKCREHSIGHKDAEAEEGRCRLAMAAVLRLYAYAHNADSPGLWAEVGEQAGGWGAHERLRWPAGRD